MHGNNSVEVTVMAILSTSMQNTERWLVMQQPPCLNIDGRAGVHSDIVKNEELLMNAAEACL